MEQGIRTNVPRSVPRDIWDTGGMLFRLGSHIAVTFRADCIQESCPLVPVTRIETLAFQTYNFVIVG